VPLLARSALAAEARQTLQVKEGPAAPTLVLRNTYREYLPLISH
jgi:hypothetical protein